MPIRPPSTRRSRSTLDARIDVASVRGRRTIAARRLLRRACGAPTPSADELLVGVSFPTWGARSGFAVEEFARRHGDFAIAGAAVGIELDDDDRIARCAIGLIGMGSTPERADAAEAEVAGRPIRDIEPDEVGRQAMADLDVGSRRPARLGGVPHAGGRGDGGARLDGGALGGTPMNEVPLRLTVNGQARDATVEPRVTLADFLREQCHLTGTHLGCEHGVCGACTVLVDGAAVRVVPRVRGAGRRRGRHHDRGHRVARRRALSRAVGVPRLPRAAVWLLHPRLRHFGDRVPP